MTGSPKVAHVLVPYLRPTETFIYDRLVNHMRYSPFILSDEPIVNLDLFPFDGPIFSLSDRPAIVRKIDAIFKMSADVSPYYRVVLGRQKPDVVHAHFGPVGAAVAPTAAMLRIPIVVSFYGIDASALLEDPHYKTAYKRLFREAALVSVLSGDMAGRLAGAGCPDEKIRVHHLAVDTEKLVPAPAEKKKGGVFRIVSAGRFVAKKGMDRLVKAFETVVRGGADAELALYGDGPLLEDVGKLVAEKRLDEKVRFCGHQPRGKVLEAIRGADSFALFSVTAPDGDMEGTPTVLIEAGALGVPSVSTRHAGIPEVVEDGRTGFLVEESDIEGFARCLGKLAADLKLRAEMGRAARGRIAAQFDIRKVMKTIESDYDTICS